jgi:hypothetical protein
LRLVGSTLELFYGVVGFRFKGVFVIIILLLVHVENNLVVVVFMPMTPVFNLHFFNKHFC